MSFALPARQITFGRSNVSAQQQQQYLQQQQQQQQQVQAQQQQQQPSHGLALPGGSGQPYNMQPRPATNLALPGPSPLSNSFSPPSQKAYQPQTQPPAQSQTPPAQANAVAGPSTPPAAAAPAAPVALTLEQQHITAVEGIVPTLQNIVATVNLDCRLDLKTIALHARNAEYNPKVGIFI